MHGFAKKGEFCHRKCTNECRDTKHNENLISVYPQFVKIDHLCKHKEDHYRGNISKLFCHLIDVLQALFGSCDNGTKAKRTENTFTLFSLCRFDLLQIHIDPCLGSNDRRNKGQNTADMEVFTQQIGAISFNNKRE